MSVLKEKTRKQITKQLRDLVIKHGSEVAIAMATSLITTIITELAERVTEDPDSAKKKKKVKKKSSKKKK